VHTFYVLEHNNNFILQLLQTKYKACCFQGTLQYNEFSPNQSLVLFFYLLVSTLQFGFQEVNCNKLQEIFISENKIAGEQGACCWRVSEEGARICSR